MPTRATARSRKTWLLSPGADSPSWLDSISPIASAFPTAKGLKVFEVLDAGRHHEVEAENVVLAAEAAGERQNLAVELVVRLAVDQHEAGGVGQRVRQERQQRRRLARPGGARHGRVLAAVLRGDPELPTPEIAAEIDRARRYARAAADRRGIVPVP